MRTKLRSKFTLLFIVCAALLAVPVVAAIADTFTITSLEASRIRL